MKLRRTFSREFKLSVLQELAVKPLVEVCRAHDIHSSIVNRWKREFESNPKEAFSGYGKTWKENAKLAKYERLVGQLYAENAFLKKALSVLKQRHLEERRKAR